MNETRFAKFVLALNAAVPMALLGWDASQHELGANPTNFAIKTTGLMSLIFLTTSLAVTPLRKATGWNWLIFFRRILGLYAFFYAAAHFAIFFTFDRSMSLSGTLSEIARRWYLVVGTIGLVAMAPLAVTSTNGMIRRLGAKRWRALHRLAYVAATAGAIHYYMQAKADKRQPTVFLAAVVLLLAYRAIAYFVKPASKAAEGASAGPKFWRGQLRVDRITAETPDVKTFRLAPLMGTELPFSFLPGQYLNLSLQIEGKRINRSYTIASSPRQRGYCELTIKREAQGLASRHLHDAVREGDLLNIGAPAGRFTFTGAEAPGVVLIAGGVGITPLMSKLRYLTDTGWKGDITLLFCARTERDIIFREELERLASRHPNLRVFVTLTRTDGSAWNGERGRISAEMLTRLVPQLTTRQVHICGPDAMAEYAGGVLRGLGVPATEIKVESFTPAARLGAGIQGEVAAAADLPEGDGVPSLAFARSGKSDDAPDGKTVLEAAEALGINIDFECRSGICGRCKVKLLSGRVTMDVQDALAPADRSMQLILSCQSRCAGAVSVDA